MKITGIDCHVLLIPSAHEKTSVLEIHGGSDRKRKLPFAIKGDSKRTWHAAPGHSASTQTICLKRTINHFGTATNGAFVSLA